MATKWLIPALTYLCFVRGQSPCTTPDGKSGECKSIVMCEPLRSMTNKPGVAGDQKEFLKQSACGFDSTIPKVCCPTGQSCVTPENNAGQCVDILNCDHIKNRLSSPAVTQQDKTYVNSLRCQGPAPFSVCCGPPPGPTPGTRPPPTSDPASAMEGDCVATVATAAPPDPASNCCGQDEDGNRILGGNATGIGQYPWLALIEYRKDNKIKLLCGGVLISGRYVLTAGHCVAGTALNSGEPTNVRLGDYDISNAGKDCVQVEGGDPGTEDCTDNPVVIPIARIITHPDYNPRHPLRRNDIALLRLADMATYTDFVRPICLPAIDVTGVAENLGPGKLIAAGWGTVSDKNSNSIVKMHVDLPFKTMEDCQPDYMVPNRRVKLWDRQMCAGGVPGKDTCKGDSGGPLMYSDGHHVEVIGIVSFGPIPCGQNVPGVYTKVYEYVPWIRSNIQP